MYTYLRFPNFTRKALTLSYDDGRDYDRRLIAIMKKYGIKGTFNLNSSRIDKEGFVKSSELNDLYYGNGMEIAIHGQEHLALPEVDMAVATRDMIKDREALEKMTGKIIKGMAYAFGSYYPQGYEGRHSLLCSGIKYARTIDSTHEFWVPEDWRYWHPTSHHADCGLKKNCDRFLAIKDSPYVMQNRPYIFYLWGHSYELENNKQWDLIEWFCEYMSNKDDIWYATNGEIVDYMSAYDRLEWSVDGKTVYNPTVIDINLSFGHKNFTVKSGQTLKIDC